MKFAKDFLFSKTTYTAIVTIIGAVIATKTKHITWTEAGWTIFAALQTINIRDTIAKMGEDWD